MQELPGRVSLFHQRCDGLHATAVGLEALRGPDFFEIDTTIYRTFHLSEKVEFQLRAETLNLLNHANFNLPDANANSTTFGYITQTFGPNQQRQWRFGLRLSF